MQKFKGDATELKFEAAGAVILDQLSTAKDEFFAGAYDCGPLGDLLHIGNRSPLSNAIDLQIFRSSFNTIYTAFTVSGTFESYITVFKKIFGDDVEVTFTVPAPGKLNIDIVAQDLTLDDFVARHIVSNAYVYDEVDYYDGDGQDHIIFASVKGFKTQYELEQMLFEMVPAGIFTTITLSFGV